MKHIERTKYLNRLKGLIGTPDIKIITGIRRSGKSLLMRDFIGFLKETRQDVNIIFIDFVDHDNEELKDYKKLHSYIKANIIEEKENFLFIDEVQMCKNFELAINSIHANNSADIYLTGSNVFLLSSDLATLFTGRFLEIKVFPFSFSEYAQYFDDEKDREELFDSYMINGGFAGSYPYKNEIDRVSYIKDVYETIITRDLIQKYELKDINVLKHLSEYMMDNISNISSLNRISDILRKNIPTANHVTIGRYCDLLCRAFIFYEATRYDIRGKKYLETSSKYYLVDTSIRYSILGMRNLDYGRAYENIVFIELLRRDYDVYVGKLYEKEVDFVAMKGSEKIYIQVSDDISNEDTLTREIAPFLQIRDAYPKVLLARTKHPRYTIEGIHVVNIADWLLDNNFSLVSKI